jgi:homoserine O-acetyltransferase
MTATDTVYTVADFRLRSGEVLPQAAIAYVTQGKLAPDGRNAILLTHGYTSSHRFALGGPAASEGSWGDLVGPGKPVDTDRYFVVAANMLGSSYGSTGPASIDPHTGRPYGPDFPDITLSDIVGQQYELLRHLGVTHLHAVVGPSFGGFQAFQWAVDYPDFIDAVAPVVTAPYSTALGSLESLTANFSSDPGWNGGHHYGSTSIVAIMTRLRIATLKGYGLEADLAPRFPDPAAREAEIARVAGEWAQVFDALRRAGRLRPHQGARAVRAVTHRHAVPARAGTADDGGAARGRCSGRVCPDRQRSRPSRLGPGRREMGRPPARLPGSAVDHAPRRAITPKAHEAAPRWSAAPSPGRRTSPATCSATS